jgi:hypothetical protein
VLKLLGERKGPPGRGEGGGCSAPAQGCTPGSEPSDLDGYVEIYEYLLVRVCFGVSWLGGEALVGRVFERFMRGVGPLHLSQRLVAVLSVAAPHVYALESSALMRGVDAPVQGSTPGTPGWVH